MSRTVYLHVGIAKTGTTYLQRTLFANRDLLRQHGTLYPGPSPASHFMGSLDLRDAKFKGHTYEQADGAWERLVSQANAFDGTTLISHETLAHARPEHIERAVADFGGSDVRVVITARDLARQIPAAWQEQVKNRGETRYEDFLSQIFSGWKPEPGGEGRFWAAQDIRGVIERWGAAVGPDHVVVVTVPPSGADRSILWTRFAEAVGLPDVEYAFASRDNSSLGVAESELLRRLNPRLRQEDWPRYDGLIKKRLAEAILAPIDTQGRLRLPREYHEAVSDITAAMTSYLASSGVRIVGASSDLEPLLDPGDGVLPSDLDDGALLDTALEVIAALALRPAAGGGTVQPSPSGRERVMRVARRVRSVLPAGVRRRLHRS